MTVIIVLAPIVWIATLIVVVMWMARHPIFRR